MTANKLIVLPINDFFYARCDNAAGGYRALSCHHPPRTFAAAFVRVALILLALVVVIVLVIVAAEVGVTILILILRQNKKLME